MSIAGISSNFSALSTIDVQATEQYTEDEQLLAQTLQTQSLQSPALLNPALSDTTDLLTSIQPATLTSTPTTLQSAFSTSGGALAALDESLTAAPSQAASFGIVASNNATGSNNNSGTNNSASNSTQPGQLQSLIQTLIQPLIQEIQEHAQQAYSNAQQGYAGLNTTTTLAAG
jgi:hypothetical protein